MSNANGQLSLLSSTALVDASIRKVFGVTEIKDKDNKVVGERITVGKRKETAQQLGLTLGKNDREALDLAISERKQQVAVKISAAVSQLPALGFGAQRLVQRTMKNGDIQIIAEWRKVAKKGSKTIAEIAKAYGKTESEMLALITKQLGGAPEDEAPLDVPSTAERMTEEELERATAPAA